MAFGFLRPNSDSVRLNRPKLADVDFSKDFDEEEDFEEDSFNNLSEEVEQENTFEEDSYEEDSYNESEDDDFDLPEEVDVDEDLPSLNSFEIPEGRPSVEDIFSVADKALEDLDNTGPQKTIDHSYVSEYHNESNTTGEGHTLFMDGELQRRIKEILEDEDNGLKIDEPSFVFRVEHRLQVISHCEKLIKDFEKDLIPDRKRIEKLAITKNENEKIEKAFLMKKIFLLEESRKNFYVIVRDSLVDLDEIFDGNFIFRNESQLIALIRKKISSIETASNTFSESLGEN